MSALTIAERVAAHNALTDRQEAAYLAGLADSAVIGRTPQHDTFAAHLRKHYADGWSDGVNMWN